ncbi:MAG: hypothetical protein CMQ11_02620 [Gammaproteobacteria bacterium]|jgi:hypothetical protein|nr:hypothetical protein [Gammaproteobacteria bacterium]
MRHLFLKAGICLSVLNLIVFVPAVMAGGTIEFGDNQSISIGAGLRAGFTRVEDAAPSGTDASSNFNIQSMRLYVNGQVNDKVKFTFNTECEGCVFGQDDNDPIGAAGDIGVLDAIVRLEFSTAFNVWAGRMLTPADRIEMNGPYYGLSWNQYTVPLLPSDQLGQAGLLGRDDGVTIWGSTGKLQYAAGLFDGVDGGPNQDDNLLFSGRLAYHFLDMEQNPGYYTSSTYYGGGGDIFTVALTYQSQTNGTGTAAEPGDFDATIIDVLFEKAMSNGSAITIEGEYKMFNSDVTAVAATDPSCFCLFDGDAYFVTAAYLLPGGSDSGKFQPYFRYTSNEPDAADSSDLTEIGLNYIINGHNLRFNVNYTSGDANLTGSKGTDADSISVGVQIQI